MDAKTYTDPQVIRMLEQYYIPVKVDHDARPDLANRYRDCCLQPAFNPQALQDRVRRLSVSREDPTI